MSRQTLKELLKPPFIRRGRMIFDSSAPERSNYKLLFEIPDFLYCEDTEKALDFTAAALNEKWERDFAEPPRWIDYKHPDGGISHICPKCDELYVGAADASDRYCPNCGARLGPPE